MKRKVLILVDSLQRAGAESVAVRVAAGLKHSDRYDPMLCATRNGGPLEALLQEHGVEYFILGRKRAGDVHRFLPILRTIRSEKIQVIHAHKMGSNLWGSLIGTLTGVPAVVAHVHGQTYSGKVRAVDKVMAALSDRIIVVSDAERTAFLTGREDLASKVKTVYNGVDCRGRHEPEPARVRQALRLPPHARRLVGIVAGLRPEKAVDTFLLAAARLRERFDDVFFVVVGDGQERDRLEADAVRLGIDSRCVFTGFREDATDIISILDVGVLCSHREGLPLTLLEYLASSKPVVATRVGGVPEAVEDGVNGFLVPAGDDAAMAEQIGRLLENKEFAAAMGKAGRRLCTEKFSLESMLSSIEAIYDEVLAK